MASAAALSAQIDMVLIQFANFRFPRPRRSNNAFERPVKPFTSARGQRAIQFAPSARLKRLRPAAQRER